MAKQSQRDILQQAWRRALDEPVRIACASRGEAERMRFALYNAVRGVKEGKEGADEVLRVAAVDVMVTWAEDDPTMRTLVLRPRFSEGVMEGILGQLGVKQEEIPTSGQSPEMVSMAERLLAKLQSGELRPEVPKQPEVVRKYGLGREEE